MNPSLQGAQDGRPAVMSQQHFGPRQQSTASALTSFVTYAKEVQDLDEKIYPDEYAAHCHLIRQLEPMLRVHGILDVMEIRNPAIAALLER
ncbi:hypothetical protein ACWF9G_28115 [Nocardia sp. NPDC055029]